jgi:hypothetical protein
MSYFFINYIKQSCLHQYLFYYFILVGLTDERLLQDTSVLCIFANKRRKSLLYSLN